MISDFVKGNKRFNYAIDIQKGISLHRAIDTYTDAHIVTKEAKQYLKPAVGLYAGAFIDVVYDHFLAIDDEHWQEYDLQRFSLSVYQLLTEYFDILPQKLQQMLPYMKSQDWLYNYQYTWGIEKSFQGVARRAVYLNNSDKAYEAFLQHYSALQQLSQRFIIDVKKFASTQFDLLLKD